MKMQKLWMAAAMAMVLVLDAGAVDFDKEIRPILAKHCYECHGPTKDKGDLRLHAKAEITKEDYILVPGKPADSEIYVRITLPEGDADIMPPKGDPLSAEQQELIKKWIEEGANFGEFTIDAEAAAHAPKEEKLPEVAAADPAALTRLREAGALAMPIAANTNLLNIDFRAVAAEIDDSHLTLLEPVAEQVYWLGLAGTNITDDGLAKIAKLKNLSRLHLEKTYIGDKGLEHLSGLTELSYLNLYGTPVTDRGLMSLLPLTKLNKLYLWQTEVTPYGSKRFLEARAGLVLNTGWEAPPEPKQPIAVAETPAATDTPEKKFAALASKFTTDSCCAKAAAAGQVCSHACCKEAFDKGEICTKCNPTAAAAPETPEAKFKALAAKFTADSCCAKAVAAGKVCEHPCCKEAFAKGEVCTKCNAGAAAPESPEAKFKALASKFSADSCCAKAVAGGKVCEHPCCKEAFGKGEVCTKCNAAAKAPETPEAKFAALAKDFKSGSCCDSAHKASKVCEHPCCKEALTKGEVCKGCNG